MHRVECIVYRVRMVGSGGSLQVTLNGNGDGIIIAVHINITSI